LQLATKKDSWRQTMMDIDQAGQHTDIASQVRCGAPKSRPRPQLSARPRVAVQDGTY
jgi:hypothetical protein